MLAIKQEKENALQKIETNLIRFRIDWSDYEKSKHKVEDEYHKVKRGLEKKRAESILIATSLYNGTDPISTAIRETLEMMDRYEDEIFEDNQRMIDDVAYNMRNITDTVRVSFDSLNQQLKATDSLISQLNETRNSIHDKYNRGHYHVGVVSTFSMLFGVLISFLALIVFKKFKHRNDPIKYTLF